MHGQGKYSYASGSVYEGAFRDNKLEGHGSYTYSTGESYVGNFYQDKKSVACSDDETSRQLTPLCFLLNTSHRRAVVYR